MLSLISHKDASLNKAEEIAEVLNEHLSEIQARLNDALPLLVEMPLNIFKETFKTL